MDFASNYEFVHNTIFQPHTQAKWDAGESCEHCKKHVKKVS